MAKKRPPGWKKHQEKKQSEKFAATVEGDFQDLLRRMEQNPENFPAWGWGGVDADGNEVSFEEGLEALTKKRNS